MKTLRANEVAKRLNIPVAQVYRLVREGILKGYKDGYFVRIFADSLERYIKKGT